MIGRVWFSVFALCCSAAAQTSAPSVVTALAGEMPSFAPERNGLPATSVPLNHVYGLLMDPQGRLIFNDETMVMRLESDGTLTVLAGRGPTAPYGQHGPSAAAADQLAFAAARGMAMDGSGNLYVADGLSNWIHQIRPDGSAVAFSASNSPRGMIFEPAAGQFLVACALDFG